MSIVDKIGGWFSFITRDKIFSSLIIILYSVVFYYVIQFAISIPYYPETSCSLEILRLLMENEVGAREASDIACTVVDVHGGISTHVSAIVGVVVGLAVSVFSIRWPSVKQPK